MKCTEYSISAEKLQMEIASFVIATMKKKEISEENKLGRSWAKLNPSWGLKLEFEVEVLS